MNAREQNRQRFPQTTRLFDMLRAAFGCSTCDCKERCRVVYARENGHEVGSPGEAWAAREIASA